MKMKFVAIVFAALCLLALPFTGSLQMAEAQQESALSRVLGGDVGAIPEALSSVLPAVPELIQWVAGFAATLLEAILALVEVFVAFCLSPTCIPLFVQMAVQGLTGALGYGVIGLIVGCIPILPIWPVNICIFPVIGALFGFLIGIFGQGELPEGMQPDMDEIKGWANTNPLENLV